MVLLERFELGRRTVIEKKAGNILESDTEAIINTVNCVGVMGKGIALQFRQAYPENFKKYKLACDRGEVQPGKMFVFSTHQMFGPTYIINFPTKRHWKGRSKIRDIKAGLDALIKEIKRLKIGSISIPPPRGEYLSWSILNSLMFIYFLD